MTISTAPGQVTDGKIKNNSNKSVTLIWKKVAGATAYRVYRYDKSGKLVSKINTRRTAYRDLDLESGKYTYKIRAFVRTKDRDSYGSYSKACSVTVK